MGSEKVHSPEKFRRRETQSSFSPPFQRDRDSRTGWYGEPYSTTSFFGSRPYGRTGAPESPEVFYDTWFYSLKSYPGDRKDPTRDPGKLFDKERTKNEGRPGR